MQFALLVAAMVALLLSTFIGLTHIHSFFGLQSEELIDLVQDTNQKLLETIEIGGLQNDTITGTVNKIETKTNVSYFGAWQKSYVANQLHKKHFARTALFGSKKVEETPNLYLKNESSPLIVVGAARIEGSSYLPANGVRGGMIAGNYYQGSALVYGPIKTSKEELPELDSAWRTYLHFLTTKEVLQNDHVQRFLENQKHSFLEKEKLFYRSASITITGNLQGNCIIKSASSIVVSATAVLDDVLLIAPKIRFLSEFNGVVQAVATKEIVVAKNVKLKYPSSLVVLKEVVGQEASVHNGSQHTITVNTGAEIAGSVVFLKRKSKGAVYNRIQSDVMIAAGAEIIGEVYCEGSTELLGTVKGSLYTARFVADQYGSIYMNHIYNGKVLKNPIDDYSGLPFINSAKTICKWMY